MPGHCGHKREQSGGLPGSSSTLAIVPRGASDMQVHEVMCSQGEKSCRRQVGWELGSHAYRLTASSGPLLSLQGPGGGGGTTQA